MSTLELAPYFHPTQIVLVDDDIDFLGNLTLQLEADLPYLLFDSTAKALSYINDKQMTQRSRRRFFRLQDSAGSEQRLALDIDAIGRELHFSDRFSQISVAMVDYAMPQMNGLDFCRQIRDPHIKKILFTGVASEEAAVAAFNDGVIDRYIRKSERYVYDNLNYTIRSLQLAHIRETFASASDVFNVSAPSWLADDHVVSLMETLRQRHRIVEYYLLDRPSGFMLIDGDGRMYRLVLASPEDHDEQVHRAQTLGAPEACVRGLERREILLSPSLLTQADDAASDALRHWARYARPATALASQHYGAWALFEERDMPGASPAPDATFSRYLDWLDTVGYALM